MNKKSAKISGVKSAVIVPAKPRVEHFSSAVSGDLKLPKEFRAVAGLDIEGKPSWFLFDLIAFWELICRIDEKMFEKLSDDEYESVSLGRTIDALEEKWPFTPEYKTEVKREYDRALRDIKAGRVYSL